MRTGLPILVGVLACACSGGGAPPAAPSREPPPAWTPEGAGPAVAEVNGEPVFASCVVAQAQAGGLAARAALDQCIDFELLAQAARARGLVTDPDAHEQRKVESVRALIAREFEPRFDGPEDVPDSALEAMWRQPAIHARYNHPEYRFVRYVRANVPKQLPPGGPEDLAAQATAARVYEALRDARGLTPAELARRATEAALPARVAVSDRPYNFPRHGRAEESFAAAAFAIPRVGQVSPPTRTKNGWDIIVVTKILPARAAGFAEAAPELRQAAFTAARERAFVDWVSELAAGHRIETYPERVPAATAVAAVSP